MAKVITISYTAPVAPAAEHINQIFRRMTFESAAADNAVFEGTYYDTNVDGWGVATPIEEFFKSCVAHPGLISALKAAMREGSFSFTSDDEREILFLSEVGTAIADQGFVIDIAEEE